MSASTRLRLFALAAVAGCLLLGTVTDAGATPIQSFCTGNATGVCPAGATAVDWDVCYDTTGDNTGSAPSGPGMSCGAGTSDSAIPVGIAGVPVRQWHLTRIPAGSRTGSPVTYTPSDWGYVTPTLGAVTGNVTAENDVLCDNGSTDILSKATTAPAGGSPSWPGNGWTPFDLTAQSIPPSGDNAYVTQFQPMPTTFTYKALERADLTQIWLGGSFGPLIIPPPTGPHPGQPLQNLYTNSPYAAGLEASVTVQGGDLNPPDNQFICRDTPQDSVVQYNQIVPPTTPGYYPRWAAITSAPDPIDGTVTRILDVQCVTVGTPPGPDSDGDCMLDSSEAAAGAVVGNIDTDGDLVIDGVDVKSGTSPAAADADADGATDFDEIFQFTDPANPDTDGDGSLDKQDDLSGFNCNAVNAVCTVANLGDTSADDNCPVDSNPSQDNTDSQPDFTNSPNTPGGAIYRGDATNPHQDHLGDVCDPDIDNDGLSNLVETSGFLLTNLAPGSAGGPPSGSLWCLPVGSPDPGGGTTLVTTLPTNPDTDSDGGLDGQECMFGSNPKSASTGSCNPTCTGTSRFPTAVLGDDPDGDLLFPSGAETFYRTQAINVPGGTQIFDLEQPGSYGSPIPDTKIGPGDPDSDGDFLNDGVEVKYYGTSPSNFDTDGDGCSDGREAGDVNGNHKVDSTDSLGISQHTSTGSLAPGKPGVPAPLGPPGTAYFVTGVRRDELVTYDVNKDGKIDSTDQLVDAKLTGNCSAGTGAQSAKPIQSSRK